MNIYQPYTYLIGWSSHNKWYYGVRYAKNCHPSDLWTTYFTSSKYVKEFRKAYGEPDIIQIRKIFYSIEKSRLWENKVLTKLKVEIDNKWLNKHSGGKKFYCSGHTETTKQKFRNRPKKSFAMFGKFGPEHQRFGKKHSDEWKNNMSVRMKNRFFSESHRKKISESNKGRKLSEEHKNKLRNQIIKESTKKKISESLTGNKNPMFGMQRSEEWKREHSIRMKGKAKGKRWFTNGFQNAMFNETDQIPDGFILGRTFTKKKSHPYLPTIHES
jgi:hypothetical protein